MATYKVEFYRFSETFVYPLYKRVKIFVPSLVLLFGIVSIDGQIWMCSCAWTLLNVFKSQLYSCKFIYTNFFIKYMVYYK